MLLLLLLLLLLSSLNVRGLSLLDLGVLPFGASKVTLGLGSNVNLGLSDARGLLGERLMDWVKGRSFLVSSERGGKTRIPGDAEVGGGDCWAGGAKVSGVNPVCGLFSGDFGTSTLVSVGSGFCEVLSLIERKPSTSHPFPLLSPRFLPPLPTCSPSPTPPSLS